MRTHVLALAAALLLAGCDWFADGGIGPPRACTEIGCESGVAFHLSEDLVAGERYELEVCLDGACTTGSIEVPTSPDGTIVGAEDGELFLDVDSDLVRLRLPEEEERGGRHRASILVTGPDGGVVVDHESEIEFERSQPNGPGCPPICWQAEVVV